MCGSRSASLLLAVGGAPLPPRSCPLGETPLRKGGGGGTCSPPPTQLCYNGHSRTRNTYIQGEVGGLRKLEHRWAAGGKQGARRTTRDKVVRPQSARLANVWFTLCGPTSSSRRGALYLPETASQRGRSAVARFLSVLLRAREAGAPSCCILHASLQIATTSI